MKKAKKHINVPNFVDLEISGPELFFGQNDIPNFETPAKNDLDLVYSSRDKITTIHFFKRVNNDLFVRFQGIGEIPVLIFI